MQTYEIGDLLQCKWNDTLWIVFGYSETSNGKLKLRRLRKGILYRKYSYPAHYELFCRPYACK